MLARLILLLLLSTLGNLLSATPAQLLRANSVLKNEPGARVHGMGNANTGRADDLSAMFYNPAGLSLMGYTELGFDHLDFGDDTFGSSIMAGVPIGSAMLAASYTNFYIRENENVSNGLMVNPYKDLSAWQAGLATGFGLYKRYIHAGFGFRYYQANLNGVDGLPQRERAFTFDFGLLTQYNLKKLGGSFFFLPEVSAGLALKNLVISPGISDKIGQDPAQINFGVSIYYAYNLMVNFDVINGFEQETEYRGGLEYWPVSFIALRAGAGQQLVNSQSVSFHWGLGIGEKAGPGKLSFEYAGAEYRPLGFTGSFKETRHRFAAHYSFENIREIKEPNGRTFRVPIALSDRYSSRLRFANFQEPGEFIDQIIQSLIPTPPPSQIVTEVDDPAPVAVEDPEVPVEPVVVPGAEDPQIFVPDPVKVYKIAVYPIKVSSTGNEDFSHEISDKVRNSQLSMAESVERLNLMREGRYKLTPWREHNEEYLAYLRRLCKFHRVELLVFNKISFDERTNEATMRMIFFRRGDDTITAQSEYTKDLDNLDEFIKLGTRELRLQAATIFDYQEESES